MLRVGVGVIAAVGLASAGCGKITFGEALTERDAGEVRDGGFVRDTGPRDAGPPPDGGCIPHLLGAMPTSFPWANDRDSLEGLFIDSFDVENCHRCHGYMKVGADTLFDEMYATPGALPMDIETRYAESAANLWKSVKESEPAIFEDTAVVGSLWYHHPAYTERLITDPAPFTAADATLILTLSNLIRSARACGSEKYLAMPLDAGSMCGEPMPPRDAGPRDAGDADGGMPDGGMDDGGDVDGGVIDSGSGSGTTGLCYCDTFPDAGINPSLVLFCE